MSKTACWGTGKLVDCAWISFGYGSIYDCSKFWISLEAAKALARFDFDGPSTNSWDGTNEELAALPARIRMDASAWSIHIPGNKEKSVEWWVEIEKEFGKNKSPIPGEYQNSMDVDTTFKKYFPEDFVIYNSVKERRDIAEGCQYHGYTYWIKGTVSVFDCFWNSKPEEAHEILKNPYDNEVDLPDLCQVLDEELAKTPQQKIEEHKIRDEQSRAWNAEHLGVDIIQSGSEYEDYYGAVIDDNVLCKRYDHGFSYVHIPKNYYTHGAQRFGGDVDGQYHETHGYVSPPEDWFKFGGTLRIRRMSGTGGSRNPRSLDVQPRHRNYQSLSEDWYIFGGSTNKEIHYGSQEWKDIHNNPKIP